MFGRENKNGNGVWGRRIARKREVNQGCFLLRRRRQQRPPGRSTRVDRGGEEELGVKGELQLNTLLFILN